MPTGPPIPTLEQNRRSILAELFAIGDMRPSDVLGRVRDGPRHLVLHRLRLPVPRFLSICLTAYDCSPCTRSLTTNLAVHRSLGGITRSAWQPEIVPVIQSRSTESGWIPRMPARLSAGNAARFLALQLTPRKTVR